MSTVLADGATTGSYEIFRQAGPEGSGPPPHSHPWDEAFYVIAGQVTFGVVGNDNLLASPGTHGIALTPKTKPAR